MSAAIEKTWSDYGIDVPFMAGGEIDTVCPRCTPMRKHRYRKDLSVNLDDGSWICHHCGRSGGLKFGWKDEQEPRPISLARPPRREFKKPAPLSPELIRLAPAAEKWLEIERGITKEVLIRNGIRATHEPGSPAEIMFPYYRNGELVNVKHRRLPKSFWMEAGAERILYGIDDLAGATMGVICEGELDKLAIEVAGIRACVSVPDGAPAPDAKSYASKFDFLEDEIAVSRLMALELIVIATDADEPGRLLAEELARRLGRHRCRLVQWPSGIKDANEMLLARGAQELADLIDQAAPWPIDGLVTVRDVEDRLLELYDAGLSRGESTGFDTLDKGYTIKPGQVTIVTGAPGSGKSELVDQIAVNLGWPVAFYSPENRPVERHVAKLAEKMLGKRFDKEAGSARMRRDELVNALPYLHETFYFVAPESPSVEEVLEVMRGVIVQYGARGIVLDPFNRFEHKRPDRMSETEYIGHFLSSIVNFAGAHGAHVWIVVHPKKLERKQDGTYPVARPWDISGSAHWFNMADNILSVWRDKTNSAEPVQVHVQKIRFSDVGELGMAELRYDRDNGRTYHDVQWIEGDQGA